MNANSGNRGPQSQAHSPDGRIRIDYYETEYRNNEWLPSPEIFDLATGEPIMPLNTSIMAARHEWRKPGRFDLIVENTFKRPFTLGFDLDADTVMLEETGEIQPIRGTRHLVERGLALPSPKDQQTGIAHPSRPRDYNWRYALLCGSIAALFFLALLYFGGVL